MNQNLETVLSQLTKESKHESTWSAPLVLNLENDSDTFSLKALIDTGEVSHVVDGIEHIANDLAEYHYPNPSDKQLRSKLCHDIIEQGIQYGNWVYYPYDHSLIRFPEENDLRLLITSRNRHLISMAEQKMLAEKTVATFGLSVGSNITASLVLSGVGGHHIIADPDYIEPTNLNRIVSPFSDIGRNKTHVTADKITKTNPYVRVTPLMDGIDLSTLRDGLLQDSRPDIIFDEIDDLSMKAHIRRYAKDNSIPLVMATDVGDKSIIDVERYDIGDVDPFLGKLKPRDINKILDESYTDKEKGQFLIKLIGFRNITPRLIKSQADIGGDLAGVPQLGTTAMLGGAFSAIIAREILLGRRLKSGRYEVSPKSILGLKSPSDLSEVCSSAGTLVSLLSR